MRTIGIHSIVLRRRMLMRWTAASTFLVLAFAGFAALATAEDKEFKGAVTDDMCGGEHMMEGMTPKECADECVRMGSSYALFVPAEKKMYLVDDPGKLKEFSGEDVVVKGSVSEDGKTIKLTSVQKAPAK
jgi:hypothetical protein